MARLQVQRTEQGLVICAEAEGVATAQLSRRSVDAELRTHARPSRGQHLEKLVDA